MRTHTIEVFFGALVLLVAALFFSYVYRTSNPTRDDPFHLTAQFERIDGILKGSDVKLRGVKVGHVSAMDFQGDDLKVRVTLSFFTPFQFPVDSVVEITSDGLMGSKYIGIVPGDSDKILKDHDEVAYTQSSVSLENLIAKFVFSAKEEPAE